MVSQYQNGIKRQNDTDLVSKYHPPYIGGDLMIPIHDPHLAKKLTLTEGYKMELTITQIAVATGTLAATALSMLAGFALAHWQHHKEVTR